MAVAEGRLFYIRSKLSGKVLDVKGNSMDPGAEVVMWTKKDENADNQLWYEDHVTGTIRCKMNDLCLELQDESTVVLNPYDRHCEGQKWMIGGDRIQMKADPKKVLDIIRNDCDDGADLCAWDFKYTKNQLWYFEFEPVNYFFLVSRMHGKVLDVYKADDSPGVKVIVWDKDDSGPDNQLWYISRDGLVRSKLNGFVLDNSSGEIITMEPYDPSNEKQGFSLSDGRIANLHDEDYVVDIEDKSEENGASIIAWEYHGGDNQHWDIEYFE